MALTAPRGFFFNDPEHALFNVAWLRGITPLRVGGLATVCLILAARQALLNPDPADFYGEIWRLLRSSAVFFLSGLPLFVLIVKTETLTSDSALHVQAVALALAVLFGALVPPFFVTADHYLGDEVDFAAPRPWQFYLGFYIRGAALGGLFSAIVLFAARERDANRRIHRTRLAHVEIDRQMTESRLRLLQAQIEPHFLFNSLASLRRLYEKAPESGRAMLHNLGDYLGAASRGGRQREVRLGDEVALARSFLAIFQVRLGRRLRVRIDVPPELEAALIPPLMVGTLLENAIKHGIEPVAAGGTVSLAARRFGKSLEVEVADDGRGFRAQCGHGVGLANVRARLETLYANAGSFDLVQNAQGGVTATIRLPRRTAVQEPGAR